MGCELGFLGISVASDVDLFRGNYGESYRKRPSFWVASITIQIVLIPIYIQRLFKVKMSVIIKLMILIRCPILGALL